MAFLNKGLRISLTDERAHHRDTEDEVTEPTPGEDADHLHTVSYRYEGGLIDYVKHLNAAKKYEVVHPEVIDFEAEDTERRISVEIAMQWTGAYSESVHTYANTISTTEGGTHEEGFRAAMTSLINRYARDKGLLKDKDDNLTGDDIREGLTAVVSVARRAAVRGPDEDEARQHRGEDVRAARGQRAARRLAGLPPERRARHYPQVDPGLRRPHGRPQGARGDPPQGSARVELDAGQGSRTASRTTPPSARCSSWRVTPPAVRPSVAATRGPRRSSRSAARSSTSSGPAWTGRSATRRSSR